MRFFIALYLIFALFPSIAFAYSKEQFEECILGSKQSPVLLGTPQKSIENFCECSLKSILDENKEIQASINQCGSLNFS